jgi:hypothetical protein
MKIIHHHLTMKKRTIAALAIIAILLSAFRDNAGKMPGFAGKWHAETRTSSFDLTLSQDGSSVYGSHCSVQQNGAKIDCVSDDDDLSITGKVNDATTAVVTFTSQMTQQKGSATIRRINDKTIEWKITADPQGEFQVPRQTILTRK